MTTACPPAPRTHLTGAALVTISAVVFSTAGLFTKGVEAGAWSVVFWRGLSAAGLSFLWLVLIGGLGDELRRFRGPALLAALVGASGTATFIPAFKFTSIANVALIWATAPFFAAALAWAFIGERPRRRTLACSALALVGVALTLRGSFGSGHLAGDALALWMVLMMAGFFVIYRHWPDTPVVLANVLASGILLVPGAVFGAPLSTSAPEIGILLGFGLIFTVASLTMTAGARLIPAAQTALLGALEVPLAPLWAWLILRELPTNWAMAGGALVLVAVLAAHPIRQKRS